MACGEAKEAWEESAGRSETEFHPPKRDLAGVRAYHDDVHDDRDLRLRSAPEAPADTEANIADSGTNTSSHTASNGADPCTSDTAPNAADPCANGEPN